MDDPFDLQRFVGAQEVAYEAALAEQAEPTTKVVRTISAASLWIAARDLGL